MMDLLKLAAAAYIGYVAGKRGYGAVLEESKALNQQVASLVSQAVAAAQEASSEAPTSSPYMTGYPSF